jgi:hypothetical protein
MPARHHDTTVASESPDGAFAVSLIGGIFILLGGFIFLIFGIGIVGIICGIIIIVGAAAARKNPSSAKGWGIGIIVLSLVSLISLGGFGIGFLLALIGGILFVAWEPPTPAYYYPPGGYAPPYGYPVQPYGYAAPAYPQYPPQQAYGQYPQQAYGQYPQGYAQYPQQAPYDPYQQQPQQAYTQYPQQQQADAQPAQPQQPNRPKEPGQQ